MWKLADFGFSTEATSRSFRGTTSIRGTQGYFAPEFLVSERPLYNNKVDIWSMGCILYEFAVGKQAFRNEFATLEYKMTSVLPAIALDKYFGEQCKESVTRCITMMLKVDANLRPTSSNLIGEFSTNLQRTLAQPFDNVQIYQEFQTSPQHTELSARFASSLHLASTINVSNVLTVKPNISMVQAAIGKEPLNYWLWHALCVLYAAQNDLDGAIEACKTGVEKSPSNPSPLMELMNLYAARGDYEAAMGCGFDLLNIKTPILQVALTITRDPLTMSIVSDIESKQNSLEL